MEPWLLTPPLSWKMYLSSTSCEADSLRGVGGCFGGLLGGLLICPYEAEDGAPTEAEPRPDASNAREESTTRHKGQLACLVLLPVR
jgi:hypothetical protein